MLLTYTCYEDKLKHNLISRHCNFLAPNQLCFVIQDFAPNVVVCY